MSITVGMVTSAVVTIACIGLWVQHYHDDEGMPWAVAAIGWGLLVLERLGG